MYGCLAPEAPVSRREAAGQRSPVSERVTRQLSLTSSTCKSRTGGENKRLVTASASALALFLGSALSSCGVSCII